MPIFGYISEDCANNPKETIVNFAGRRGKYVSRIKKHIAKNSQTQLKLLGWICPKIGFTDKP
jgi:hypothetical protein